MPIPESQLLTWSNPGGTDAAKKSHELIRQALGADRSLVRGKNYDVFLQGSYKNDTNIRGDSDVDVVVRFNDAWYFDTTQLSAFDRAAFESWGSAPAYALTEFRRDVLATLNFYFGASVAVHSKCITVKTGLTGMTADVVVCLPHRRYTRFRNAQDQSYLEGIEFRTNDNLNLSVINFPEQHYANGVTKNADSATKSWYKPTVRMFKNARNACVDRGICARDSVPSYFIECLLYNIPDGLFGGSFDSTYRWIVSWLQTETLDNYLCQNGITYLFGYEQTQWQVRDAKQFAYALATLASTW